MDTLNLSEIDPACPSASPSHTVAGGDVHSLNGHDGQDNFALTQKVNAHTQPAMQSTDEQDGNSSQEGIVTENLNGDIENTQHIKMQVSKARTLHINMPTNTDNKQHKTGYCRTEYKVHPLASALPACSSEEYDALKESIRAVGRILIPGVTLDGQLLDGRNRYKIAKELDIPFPTVELDDVDPREFVIAQNLTRRHMTQAQRGIAAVNVYGWLPNGVKSSARGAEDVKSTEELAKIAGTSPRTIAQAKTVLKAALPEVVNAVNCGKISLKKAEYISKLPRDEQVAAISLSTNALEKIVRRKPANDEAIESGDIASDPHTDSPDEPLFKRLTRDTVDPRGMSDKDGDIKLEPEYVKELRAECDKLFSLVDALEKDASMLNFVDDKLKFIQNRLFEHRERLGISDRTN
ncbi:ParB/RepB/Spo0J family partition protein [Oxalobacter sp. OttesenSCG-928-P03]|nr:ParB/RepB/Spo0J family partition protein [Oxalobacter sp. OttesenSCG-928-P03]